MDEIKCSAFKRVRDGSALRDDAPRSRERAAAAGDDIIAGARPIKRVATEPASPARPCFLLPAPQKNDAGDAVLDVEELLLRALEDELEPHEESVGRSAVVTVAPAKLPPSWLSVAVDEDDNYDESDDDETL